jgi:hypothetical protein
VTLLVSFGLLAKLVAVGLVVFLLGSLQTLHGRVRDLRLRRLERKARREERAA